MAPHTLRALLSWPVGILGAILVPLVVCPFTAVPWPVSMLAGLLGLTMAGFALMALFCPGQRTHRLLSWGYGLAYVALAGGWMAAIQAAPSATMSAGPNSAAGWQAFWFTFPWIAGSVPVLAILIGLHIHLWRSSSFDAFILPVEPEPPGEAVAENLRTGGDDPQFRRQCGLSVFLHLLLLFGPLLMVRECTQVKLGPLDGGGTPPPPRPLPSIFVKPIKQKPIIINTNSPICFFRPDLKDSDVARQVEELSRRPREVTGEGLPNRPRGIGDKNRSGIKIGDPHGRFRFVRLQYACSDWDDGLNENADRNLLRHLKNHFGGAPVATNGESITADTLSRLPGKNDPPFLFLTGEGGFSLSGSEVKALRAYLDRGGTIFADAGNGAWGTSLRRLAQQLTDRSLVSLSDDDELFRAFHDLGTEGADPLWQHAGNRMLGLRNTVTGRWQILMHPGDINDTWKDGSSGVSQRLAERNLKLGANIAYYASASWSLTRQKESRR